MKACRSTQRLLDAQFAGELDFDREVWLQEHMRTCQTCAKRFEAQRELLERLGSFREAPLARLDLDRFVQGVQGRIAGEEQEAQPVPGSTGSPVLRWALPLAAAALILVGMGWWVKSQPSATQPDTLTVADANGAEQPVADPLQEKPTPQVGPQEPAPIEPVADSEDFSSQRHRAAAQTLRLALGDVSGSQPDWASFEDRTRVLRDGGWPLASLLSGLTNDRDLGVARPALLALAREGGGLAVHKLWRLREHADLGADALRAMASEGLLSPKRLAQLYGEGAHSKWAALQCEPLEGQAALQVAREVVRRSALGGVQEESMDWLAKVLVQAGTDGGRQALSWLHEPKLETSKWAARVAKREDLHGLLGLYLAQGRGDAWTMGALALAAEYKSPLWLDFLDNCSRRSRTVQPAVLALIAQDGLPALELLLQVEFEALMGEEAWLVAWRQAIAGQGDRIVELVRTMRSRGAYGEAEQLGEILLLGGDAEMGLAMVELAADSDFAAHLRCSLVDEVGSRKAAHCVASLEGLFLSLGRQDRDLAACTLLALHQLAGEDPLMRLLGSGRDALESNELERLIVLCSSKSGRSPRERRYLVARKLRSFLGQRTSLILE